MGGKLHIVLVPPRMSRCSSFLFSTSPITSLKLILANLRYFLMTSRTRLLCCSLLLTMITEAFFVLTAWWIALTQTQAVLPIWLAAVTWMNLCLSFTILSWNG